MPHYELVLIIKSLPRPQLTQVVKRCCEQVWSTGGIVRGMESLGVRKLPYKMRTEEGTHSEGNYFLLDLHTPSEFSNRLRDGLHQDKQVIRPTLIKIEEEFVRECDSGPCRFGETVNPDFERKTWRRQAQKKLVKLRKR